jgi:hypothetical protein
MHIGTLREGHLHASLKARYVRPGDSVEAQVGAYVVDILRDDLIIEVQTANFSRCAAKVRKLVVDHPVRLVYPVPQDLWIVRLPQEEGGTPSRRKSPLRRNVFDIFEQLVSFPDLITHENFQLDVVLTQEEELRAYVPGKRWRRRGWTTVERRLLDVTDTVTLHTPAAFLALLPPDLPDEFLTSDLAAAIARPRRLAQQVAYCLAKSGLIHPVARRGNAIVYSRVG